ncbi:hypothetical protein ACFFTN_01385 [Aminobacter aganoensis]|uniref:DeoR/GlpR family transcriptional regulator of sugar metabolism n=1 Tax=Aminobacter aganoensis TaxID=83264 RepID=A0A7X0KJW6_9HYPH|nr:hypothetical protein [Aminobacter aganoensis]MBB6353488.1 DeoR/GlpR family transcriptional regulator of sugar metabolism [Aminobacter aganoensis]
MADIYITEYATLARDGHNYLIAAGKEPSVAEQQIANPATSTQSSAFNAQTAFIMVHASAAAHVAVGANPTAVNNRHRLGAGETRFYGVPQGAGYKLAAINGS